VGSGREICSDRNFQRLAHSETGIEEFMRLLDEQVAGYLCRKRVIDGLKDLTTRVEAAENKLYLVKNLGKAKSKLEADEQVMVDKYSTLDIKEKIQTLNNRLQAMIDEGRLSVEEKPQVHEQLLARRARAKAEDKAKLVEKLEGMISKVSKAEPIELPVPNLDEVYPLHLELKDMLRAERRPAKSQTAEERVMLVRKPDVEQAIRAWSDRSRMWFESEFEFNPRLERALEIMMKARAEERKREEEAAAERKRLAEEEALEQKRLAAVEAAERKERELEAKLEAKRAEAALKPQKAAPQPKKKEKAKAIKLDNRDLFTAPTQPGVEEQAEDSHEDSHEEAEEEVTSAPTPPPEPERAAAAAPAKKRQGSDAKAAAKVITESVWKEPATAPAPPTDEGPPAADASEEEEEDLPSLATAAKAAPAAKKTPPPAPKKKEKKKFAKMSVAALGFDANNPNYVN